MILAPQRGREKDPSPDLVPRPPSPLGEGWGLLGAPPHPTIISLSLGRGGTARRRGPHVVRVVGVRGFFLTLGIRREMYSWSCQTSTATPAEPGGLPTD